MFRATRNDRKLSLGQVKSLLPILEVELTFDDEEKLVLVLVLVPDELALKLHEFDVLTVQGTNDSRMPMITDQVQLFPKVDFVHDRQFETTEGSDPCWLVGFVMGLSCQPRFGSLCPLRPRLGYWLKYGVREDDSDAGEAK